MLRKFLPLFILSVIALLLAIAFVVASPFFQGDDEVVEEKEEEIVLSSIEKKLNEIVIPEVRFDNVTMEEAIEFLRLRSIECDRSGVDDSQKGIGFVMRSSKVRSDDGLDGDDSFGDTADPNAILIKWLHLTDVPLDILLTEICEEAQLKWEIDPVSHKIVITPLAPIRNKLGDLRISKFDVKNETLEQVIKKLTSRVLEEDAGGAASRNMSYVIRSPRVSSEDPKMKGAPKRVSLVVEDRSFPELMDLVCEKFGVVWKVDEFAITVYPKEVNKTPEKPAEIDPGDPFSGAAGGDSEDDPFGK